MCVYTSSYKIFCQVCRSADKQGLLTSQSPFVHDGFSNWKKALKRFKDHERSATHREAVSKLQARSLAVNVGAMISKQYYDEAEKRNNHAILMKLLHCIRYLARQGLAFCGHHEDSVAFEGNLYQLLLLKQLIHHSLPHGFRGVITFHLLLSMKLSLFVATQS